MINKKRELLLQVSIILACVIILAVRFSDTPTKAQTGCNNEPPLHINPTREAWPPGKNVSVIVFDTTDPIDFQIISDAIREWNADSEANCSNVTFGAATRAGRPYVEGEFVPDDTIFVTRPSNSQLDPFYRNFGTPAQNLRAARIRIWNLVTHTSSNDPERFRKLVAHETGHSFGLRNETYPGVQGRTIMGTAINITGCDTEAIERVYCPATPTPTPMPTPTPTPVPGRCNGEPDFVLFPPTGCAAGFALGEGTCTRTQTYQTRCIDALAEYDSGTCLCVGSCLPELGCSPIVVDILGDGFSLTNAPNGVDFDINNDGGVERLAWTSVDSDDAWLALDRNGNGIIDGGKELFGNVSPQEPPIRGEEMNGFSALAVYDDPDYGGNGDGKISQQDAIFDSLKLWQDANHNGVSESCEMFSLPDLGLRVIDLRYKQSRRVDVHGNQFKYRARVRDAQNAHLGRWAWDVFLVVQ